MSIYNCKREGDRYRITKFDDDVNVESSYLCSLAECECPAGPRPTCRHRQMLSKFLARGAVDTGECYNYEHMSWVSLIEAPDHPPLPEGVTMIGLDDPAKLHNTIADALGEPKLPEPFDRRGM